MTEEDLKRLKELVIKYEELYDIFDRLKKTDPQNINYEKQDLMIRAKNDEIIDLLSYYDGNFEAIDRTLLFIEKLNRRVILNEVFLPLQSKEVLVLKKIHIDLNAARNIDVEEFKKTIPSIFRKDAEEIETNTYLSIVFQVFREETDLRTIEMLEQDHEFDDIKFNLAFLNDNVYTYLMKRNFASVPHEFTNHTIMDPHNDSFTISNKKKQEFSSGYGIILYAQTCRLYATCNNPKMKKYLRYIIRTAALFMDDFTIYNTISYIKDIKAYEELVGLIRYRKQDLDLANQEDINLSNATRDALVDLIMASTRVRNSYKDLAVLECNNKTDSPLYEQSIEQLRINKEKEEKALHYFELFTDEVIDALEYLDKAIDDRRYSSNVPQTSFNNVDEEMVLLRIVNKLDKIALSNDPLYLEDYDGKLLSHTKFTTEEEKDFLRYYYQYYDDAFNLELIKLIPFEEDEEQIWYKYNLAYLDDFAEDELLKGKIDHLPSNFDDMILKDLTSVDDEKSRFANNVYAFSRYYMIIDDIFEYDDEFVFGTIDDDEEYEEPEVDEDYQDLMNEMYQDGDIEVECTVEELSTFKYNVLITQFKVLTLFADEKGIEEIKKMLDQKYKYFGENRKLIFENLYDILNNSNTLKKKENADINQKRNS